MGAVTESAPEGARNTMLCGPTDSSVGTDRRRREEWACQGANCLYEAGCVESGQHEVMAKIYIYDCMLRLCASILRIVPNNEIIDVTQ